ncbi:hypothetical protein EYF80_040501 [Liparis tanakae]|uniref:Uncharacterized protein n=1 Tax=Liparis tanakae TaxID=230148 RepID=A0A4Z2G701_9TELE|nr:hypothetical protein EYF80_040501 [Liparis tanakae]
MIHAPKPKSDSSEPLILIGRLVSPVVLLALAKLSHTGQHSPSGVTCFSQPGSSSHCSWSHTATPLSHAHTRHASGFQMSSCRWTSPSTEQLSFSSGGRTFLKRSLRRIRQGGGNAPRSSQTTSSHTAVPATHAQIRHGSGFHISSEAHSDHLSQGEQQADGNP